MKPVSKADQALLSELARKLELAFWNTRCDGGGVRFIAGAAATIRAINGRLVVRIRPQAAARAEPHRLRLLDAGVLSFDDGELIVERLPEGREIGTLRDTAGLAREWGTAAPSVRSAQNAGK